MSGPRTLLAKLPVQKLDVDLSSVTLSTGAWTQILAAASNLKACTALQIAYSGEGILRLSTGDASEEDDYELPFYVFPGGSLDTLIPVEIARLKRLSARSVDQAVATGRLIINFYG